MKFNVITLFPDFVEQITKQGVVGKGFEAGLLELNCYNPRDYTTNKHNRVDDTPYGGGPGMLMQVQPVKDAILATKKRAGQAKVCYLSPQGAVLNQAKVEQIAQMQEVILLCGRYEGIDERLFSYIDEEISVGDYVLSGGELAAMTLIDAVGRKVPGVLGDFASSQMDSFSDGLLDYPHYTRPEEFEGMKVPAVLLSGNHAQIKKWRRLKSLEKTLLKRPELLKKVELSAEEKRFLANIEKGLKESIK